MPRNKRPKGPNKDPVLRHSDLGFFLTDGESSPRDILLQALLSAKQDPEGRQRLADELLGAIGVVLEIDCCEEFRRQAKLDIIRRGL